MTAGSRGVGGIQRSVEGERGLWGSTGIAIRRCCKASQRGGEDDRGRWSIGQGRKHLQAVG